jgi:hypothetical protein
MIAFIRTMPVTGWIEVGVKNGCYDIDLYTAKLLRLPLDSPLATNTLAIRIVFPLIRVTQVSFNLAVLQASLRKHKKSANKGACSSS